MPMNDLMRHLRNRPWLAVVALAVLQAGILYVIAAGTTFCCDVAYYLRAGESFWRDGLLWHDDYAGYRFYIAPLVFGFLELLSHTFLPERALAATMPFLLCSLFLITSSIASVFVFRRDGLRRWSLFAIPLLLNPLALALIPYPLQESVIVAGCLPLLFVLLAHRFDRLPWQSFIAGLCIAIAVMTRPTLFWIALPIVFYVFYPAIAARRWNRHATLGAGLLVLVVAAIYLPQAYIRWNLPNTLSPTRMTDVVDKQIGYGVDMLEYNTLQDGPVFSGSPVYSPYRALPKEAKTLSFYIDQPAEGVFLALIHAWSAFDFVSFRPYVPKSAIRIVNFTLIVSALITALGVLAIWRMIGDTQQRTLGLTLAGLFLLNCLYVAVSATENRFGLLGFLALSVAAWQALIAPEGRKLCLRAAPLVAGYVCLCLIISALLFYRAGWLWPGNPP